ncbi:hypothetical protein BV232_14495, partial [Lactiplantibacillus plantarum]
MIFKDLNEAQKAYQSGYVHLHSRVGIQVSSMPDKPFTDDQKQAVLVTTVGKAIFNNILPGKFPYLNEPTNDNLIAGTPDKYFLKPGEDIHQFLDA